MWRENRSLKRRLSQAKLRDRQASIEAIDFRRPRGLDRSQIRSLSNCDWVARHHNLIISGPCGVGKSFLACALAQQAIRERYTAFYVRQSQLFRDLARARADGSLEKRFRQLARVEVLIVDDWAMAPLGESELREQGGLGAILCLLTSMESCRVPPARKLASPRGELVFLNLRPHCFETFKLYAIFY